MVAESESIKYCLDKVLFYQQCKCLSIPAIETGSSLDGLNAECFVVKERYGAGSHQIGLKLSSDQAKLHACQLSYPIFQPFIRGREYSIDAYVNKHGQVQGVVCRSRDIIANGESQVTTTVNDTVLERLCSRYIGRLRLYGHVVLQVLVDEQGHMMVIECNARFGGASTLSIASGLDSFYWFLLESRGENLQQYPFYRSKQQLRQIRYPQDLIMEVNQ
jgi:carbamoyl-phosphate synthase large subunit